MNVETGTPRGCQGQALQASPERTYYIVPPGMSVIFRDELGNDVETASPFPPLI